MENAIIGRKEEKKVLRELLSSNKPEFLALYGRRRVGKTFLVSEFFEGKGCFFELIGSKGASNEVHMDRFLRELSEKFRNGNEREDAGTWEECFQLLKDAIDETIQRAPERKIIVFFDELPWIDMSGSGFTASLDYFWNRYFSRSRYKNMLLIICGSAASWILDKIIDNKGGLHNRITRIMRLAPFTLSEADAYLRSQGIVFEKRHVLEIYMALGGIPFYLSLITRGASSAQIINNLCFKKDGFLVDEFERLFSSLFDNHETHVKIIRALAGVKKGIDRSGLLRAASLTSGGEITAALRELEESGFIMRIRGLKKKRRGSIYRCIDEYAIFYLQWIEPVRSGISRGGTPDYWLKRSNTASWKAWAGYAFESICVKHIHRIKNALGISGVITFESSWHYRPGPGSGERGGQIDLVIERADRTVNLCEVKFSNGKIRLSKDYLETLAYKKELFRRFAKTNSHIVQTMISSYGIEETPASCAVIDNQITMRDLFEP